MADKIKTWWSDDRRWFCVLVNDGVSQATVSLTPEEAAALTFTPAQSAGMRDALEFYANSKRYEGANTSPLPDDPFQPQELVYRLDVTRDGGRIARKALAAQPPAAPVETKSASEMIAACYEGLCPDGSSALDFEWARQRGYILPNNGSGKLSPAQCSAANEGEGIIAELDRLRLKAFRSNSEPDRAAYFDRVSRAYQRGELVAATEPQEAQVSAGSGPVIGPNVQTTEFEDNSGADPAWHKIQDQIDEWAQQTLPPDHAAAIMSWSDRLAQHLTVTTTELRGAEHHARRETQAAILSALLREARQYVSDAGCDEDDETQNHSTALLSAIDTALSLSRQTEGE